MSKDQAESAQPRRIAFCENGAGYGGAIISLAAYLENISARFEPFLYTALGSQPYRQLGRLGRWRQIRHWRLLDTRWLRERGWPLASAFDNLVNLLPNVLRYCLAFRRDRIALVYLNNDPICNLAPALAARLCGLPMVLHMRGFCDAAASTSWVLARVDRSIAVSQWIRRDLLAHGAAESRCAVVPEGLDLSVFRPQAGDVSLLARLGIPEGAPVITLVGGLADWKGQDVLLGACPAIFAQFPQVHVLLVGASHVENNPYARAIVALAGAADMAGRVHLTGARSDVPALLALSTIVLHASTLPEPFGRTFLEGMAMGKPVIAANAGGPAEVIQDGRDGLLVEPGQPALLAQAICRLLGDPALRQALGEAALRKAQDYSIRRHAQAIDAVIAEALNGVGR